MYAIIDCNNFYASCERLFNPALQNKPIVVLSNNDGCVIARSNEAKALGIKMGEPFFQIKALCQQQQVVVFSSNYTLYGDLSQRVMQVIEASWPAVEVYSIDEAFLDLRSMPAEQQQPFCNYLQARIRQYTGIPVSIGLGPTKTLAKLANFIAKKELKIPVFALDSDSPWLKRIPVGEVWGVGRQWDKGLQTAGILSAADLAAADLRWVKARFNVILQRTVLELRGTACAELAEVEARQSIISSKSFGRLQTDYSMLAQAISSHCARAWEKLWRQESCVRYLSVFVQTNRFRQDLPQYHQSIGFKLVQPTDDLRHLVRCAKWCLRKIYKSGYHYQKVGVHLGDLLPRDQIQLDLFSNFDDNGQQQSRRLMRLMEQVNQKYGRHSLRLAAEGMVKPWDMRAQRRSPPYTTCWQSLPVVYC